MNEGRTRTAGSTGRDRTQPKVSFDSLFKLDYLKILFLVLFTILVYIPAIHGGYIWDDDMYVTQNQNLESVDGLARIWTNPQSSPQYYPLVFSSFWLEHQLWGLDPAGYHTVNVLLHACGAVLLYFVLRGLSVEGAFLAALVFAVHPVYVESVAWVSERKNVLSGLFYLCSFLLLARFFRLGGDTDDKPGGRHWYYVLGIVAFGCALLSKTVTATLPAAFILVLWWKRGRVTLRELLYLAPLFVIGGSLGLLTAWLEKTQVGAQEINWGLSFLDRFLIAGRALWFYLWKLVWPAKLAFNYQRWRVDDHVWWQYAYPLSMLGLTALLWGLRRTIGRAPLCALLFFAVSLFPVLGFLDVYPFRYSFVADHFQYLASVGIIALVVGGGARLVKIHYPSRLKTYATIAILVAGILSVKSWHQEYAYADGMTLWTETLKTNPESALAHDNLGSALSKQGKLQEAMAHFQEALRINPNSERASLQPGSGAGCPRANGRGD